MTDTPEDDFTPDGIKRVISANYDLLDAWYAARGITTERMEMKATIARLEADRAAQAERMARMEEALRDWLDAEDTWDGDFADDDRIARAKDAARALSQEGSDA